MRTVSETVGPKVSLVVPVNSPEVMTSVLNRNVGATTLGEPLQVSSKATTRSSTVVACGETSNVMR